jgi:hypothetical protein
MEKEFVPYDIALAMKELGFDEPCLAFHSKIYGLMLANTNSIIEEAGEVLAPLYQQAFRWFREKHGLYHQIGWFGGDEYLCAISPSSYTAEFETYQKAQDACLRKLIEIVKEKNK